MIHSFLTTLQSINPVALSLGPIQIHWYGLSYALGALLIWMLARRLSLLPPRTVHPDTYDDLLVWVMVGIVLGGRLAYVLFYDLDHYLQDPSKILYTWQGGMAFHGGLAGGILGGYLYCLKNKLPYFEVGDVVFTGVPIGLFLGRLANFINGEAYGRITTHTWGLVFPHGGPYPRHPSQLYEAFFEGIVLFVILMGLNTLPTIRARRGMILGVFLVLYALFRIGVEFVREPNENLGYYFGAFTMGQLLSVPVFIFGIGLMMCALRRGAHAQA